MRKRRRFTADFKATVALEALRGDKTIQEIAARVSAAKVSSEIEKARDIVPNKASQKETRQYTIEKT